MMAELQSAHRGCLLGLAVGDAMGYAVDSKSWAEIQEDYGPNGLLGYDLVNGYADVTSYTQIAAFAANGLLFGITRGQIRGRMAPLVRYIEVAVREWSRSQHYCEPKQNYCWLSTVPELKRRRCMDTWMLSILSREKLGTMEEPVNRSANPAAITEAIPVALLMQDLNLTAEERDRLSAEAVALTHGSPMAFLPGAIIAYLLGRVLRKPEIPLQTLIEESMEAFDDQFGREYAQAADILALMKQAIAMSRDWRAKPVEAMEKLKCETGAQVLAGAVYAALVGQHDFDTAMIAAVNHSGRSAAVGAVAGAILGARLGEDALPEFYIECLEPAEVLRELADDLYDGCPMEMGSKLFDLDWDYKYLHGGQ